MVVYSRKVFFYETDAQGIVHHSNYPRYFEEARGYFLEKNNLPYEKIREELGLDVVLTQLSIEYKKYLTFGDSFFIHLKPKIENKYFFSFEYELKNQEDKICCIGRTEHCFVSIKTKKIVSIPNIFLSIITKVKM